MNIYVTQSLVIFCLGCTLLSSSRLGADETSSRESRQLEFRGVITSPDGALFSLRDATNAVTFWIELGQIRHGIETVEFDSDTNTLRVRHGGELRTLHLSTSKVSAEAEPRPGLRAGVYALEDLNIDELEATIKADERRHHLEAFGERWGAAAAESAELRLFEREIFRLTREGSIALAAERRHYAEGSEEYQRAREKGMDIGQEMNALVRRIEAAIAAHPAFPGEDVNLFRNRSSFGIETGTDGIDYVHLSSTAGYTVSAPWFRESRPED